MRDMEGTWDMIESSTRTKAHGTTSDFRTKFFGLFRFSLDINRKASFAQLFCDAHFFKSLASLGAILVRMHGWWGNLASRARLRVAV